MTDDVRLELLLRDTLRASAPTHAPASLRLATLSATSHARQRPRWLAAVRARPLSLEGHVAAGSPALRLALLVALLAALAAVAIAGAGALLARHTIRVPDAMPVISPSGSMAVPRVRHTATLLRDGRVLVVGGNADFSMAPLGSAELWDPVTSQFTITGSLGTPREIATATLLRDGRVLVVGGLDVDAVASAEVWSPATGQFTPAGTMALTRYAHTATLLADGRVLVIGGAAGRIGGVSRASAEIWDPATGTFAPTGSMAEARSGHTATLLPDGRVLVIGGTQPKVLGESSAAEIWSPATGQFSPAGDLWVGRSGHTATLLPDGRVLVIGGSGSTDAAMPLEVWSPADASFTPSWPRAGGFGGYIQGTAALLPDGRVLVVDGNSGGSVEIWDPVTGSFLRLGFLATPREGNTTTLLPDGRALVAGGTHANTTEVLATSELIQP